MEIINTLLIEAMQGETDAEERYMAYAGQAVAEGYSGVAGLFTGLSYAEAVHAANHKRALEKNSYTGPLPKATIPKSHGATLDNLRMSLKGELEEFSTMYPSFRRQITKKHGDVFVAKIALLSIKWAAESEKNHHALLLAAVKMMEKGSDMDAGDYYLCTVCGNLHFSSLPPEELCPVCGHDLMFYSKVDVLL
jgi:rubrerythrin